MRISIVTVCFNCVTMIEETIQSIIGQTYTDIEYIIIDGGSTDGTVDIIRRYANRIAYWISEPDKGIYDAMNKGIYAATGDYLIFINAGDKLATPSIISEIVNLRINSDVVYGNLIMCFTEATVLAIPDELSNFSTRFPIYHPATLTKTDLLKNTHYDANLKICGDYNFYLKLYCQGKSFQYIDVTIAIFDATDGLSNSRLVDNFIEAAKINGSYGSVAFYIALNKLRFRQIAKKYLKIFFPEFVRNRNIKAIESNQLFTKL